MVLDIIGEVYTSMSRNKLRICLTGFSIAWGIFMLIVLLGSGNGLMNGMTSNFASMMDSKITINPGWTSVSVGGMTNWRQVELDMTDVEYLRGRYPQHVQKVIPEVQASATLNVGQNYSSTTLRGAYSEYIDKGNYTILTGRCINENDIREQRKVVILPEETAEKLFPDGSDCVGQWVSASGVMFQVIGTYKRKMAGRNTPTLMPFTTCVSIYKPDMKLSRIELWTHGLNTVEDNEMFDQVLRDVFARRKQFASNDSQAVWIDNSYEEYLQMQKIFYGLQLFIWIIGIATLIAGVTGISNIMLITVKERTHEFGIRKAIGAKPAEIVRLVIIESIAITIVFGYVGMFLGIGLTQLIKTVLETMSAQGDGDNPLAQAFSNPTVDLGIIFMATGVMVIGGVIAGYVPAKRAVSIKPVEALAEQ